jgi:hypothetical protein
LYTQAVGAATFMVKMQNKHMRHDLGQPIILSVFIEKDGWWYTVHSTDGEGSGIAWPKNLT